LVICTDYTLSEFSVNKTGRENAEIEVICGPGQFRVPGSAKKDITAESCIQIISPITAASPPYTTL